MLRYVFKPKGSRVFRGRYRIGDNTKIFDVPLHTDKRHVAEAELRQMVKELEEEKLGLIKPRALRDATKIPLLEHLTDFIADITARGRCKNHISHTKSRLKRLFAECNWISLKDISPDSFNKWRARQTFSPKTANEYLGHANALFNWMERNERLERNPLKIVGKSETRGKERYVRRALSDSELATLIETSGKRALPYMLAAYTGLRRGEIQKLTWDDLHLDEERPYILARASTTKNKKTAVLPLILPLVTALKEFRAKQNTVSGKVFRYGVPKAVTLLKDLLACGIQGVDEHGRHLDFHALRHTFATMLARAGVSPRVAMELMRHSDMRLTAKTYTDAMSLPLFGELDKITSLLPSLIASLNCEKPGLKGDISDQTELQKKIADCVLTDDGRTVLTELVPSLENFEVAERGGFEPHKIPPIITEIRTTTHKETHNFQSRQAPTCPK
jgi:integrase